jgi:hypothetical protein
VGLALMQGSLNAGRANPRPAGSQGDKPDSVALLEQALFLRQHGEYAPGGRENWHDWDLRAEAFLRGWLERDRGCSP